MSSDKPPIIAFAQFFDDIRLEVTGKFILIGQYVGTMLIIPGTQLVDRLAVLLTVRWPRDHMPSSLGVNVDIPGQPPIVQALPTPSTPDFADKPLSPFAGIATQAILQLRFPPLRSGDIIDVWFEADGHKFPAGRLYVSDKAPILTSMLDGSGMPAATAI